MHTRKNIFFALLTILLVVSLSEVFFQFLVILIPRFNKLFVSPYVAVSDTIPDARLVKKGNPDFPDHDRNGFRNPEVPSKVDIVALGDSQTYGTNYKSSESWPRQLETMTRKSVYSMSLGGYAPVHSLIMWEDAVALKPKIIIEAFYAGNDVFESFYTVYNYGKLSELKSGGLSTQDRIMNLERVAPLLDSAVEIMKKGNFQADNKVASLKGNSQYTPLAFLSQWGAPLQNFLSAHSKVYALCRRVVFVLTPQTRKSIDEEWLEKKAFAESHRDYWDVFDNGKFRTIFTPAYRLIALNLQDPRIEEGLHISLRAMQRMNELARKENIRFVVLMIPTKESVFKELNTRPSKNYSLLIQNEEKLWGILKENFKANNIEYLDVLPGMKEQLSLGNNLYQYRMPQDGHPSSHGYKAIAKLVANYLESTDNKKK